MNLNQVGLESALEGDDGLDDERVGVLHVQVHEAHHRDTHELRPEGVLDLLRVVRVHGRRHELALFRGSHRRRLDILESGEVLLLVDLDLGVEVDASNDHVANDVDRANDVKDVRVFEGDSLRHLHHSKNDDDVGYLRAESGHFDDLLRIEG